MLRLGYTNYATNGGVDWCCRGCILPGGVGLAVNVHGCAIVH